MTLNIRPHHPKDIPWILSLSDRLTAFDLPAWRQAETINDANQTLLKKALEEPEPGSTFLIAEMDGGVRAGFIFLQTETEFFSRQPQGYISDLVVHPDHEGQGVGRALMQAAETWAQDNGFPVLTLYVFASNTRARQLYEKVGFQADLIKYARPIPPKV